MSAPTPSIFDTALLVGTVASVSASRVRINLRNEKQAGGALVNGVRYGMGEVGEFVVVEAEGAALFGRVLETRLPEKERLSVEPQIGKSHEIHPIGEVQLLATISVTDLSIKAGVSTYPRLGARVFCAPHELVSSIPARIGSVGEKPQVVLQLGSVKNARDAQIAATPEKVFGRHCAVLGATGGGKSYTLARLIEEVGRLGGKAVLLDASGEYFRLSGAVKHVHLGPEPDEPSDSEECIVPFTQLTESDFISLFQPAGKTQGPKFRAAIRSLRLAKLRPEIVDAKGKLVVNGVLKKAGREKKAVEQAEADVAIAAQLDSPRTAFDVRKLVQQIKEECIFENAKKPDPTDRYKKLDDFTMWGDYEESSYSYCLTLITRINSILQSPEFRCVFDVGAKTSLFTRIDEFCKAEDKSNLLRISLENLSFDFNAREIITNTIGRHFLLAARKGSFKSLPLLLFVDEAHQFLNKTIGLEEYATRLDAFELIAKEGRKYSLNICLATQRPRDVPEGVLSQMGTLIVHRLTNDKDREVVERACGEIDRSASAFLPNLEPGEAAIIGVDFPIPLTIQMEEPTQKPESKGPNFQTYWSK
jgi:hypothetical protein